RTIGASLIGAAAIAGSWSARAQAHDDRTNHGTGSAGPGDHKPGALVQAVREATERFRDPAFAGAEGYQPLFGCVSGPERGAMGQHFVNFPFVGDGLLDVTHPELIIYETL